MRYVLFVIPAEAGIQYAIRLVQIDSRLRGNDKIDMPLFVIPAEAGIQYVVRLIQKIPTGVYLVLDTGRNNNDN